MQLLGRHRAIHLTPPMLWIFRFMTLAWAVLFPRQRCIAPGVSSKTARRLEAISRKFPLAPSAHLLVVKFHSEPPSRFTVAVGTCVSSRAPRTEPYVRLSRIRLPPWVCDGEAIARPRMKDDRFREPGLRPLRHPYPRDAILVAATPQRAPPEVDDMVPEHGQCTGVGRHCVIAEVATNDVPQPFPLIGEWLVHALPQLLFDHPQLRPHAISPGLPF